jgi:hypothetical protein
MKVLLVVSAILLLLAVIELPIGYYTFLRIIVTFTAALVLYKERIIDLGIWFICFVMIIILFNPIIPIHLRDRSIWFVIDIVVAGVFIIKAMSLKSNKQ